MFNFVQVKEDENFNRRNTFSISRIKISADEEIGQKRAFFKGLKLGSRFPGLFMSIIKKIIMIPVITIQGIVIGILLNFSWHFFLAEIIGWKDTAPDWYFNIQNTVFMLICLLGLVGWIIISFRLSRKSWTSAPRALGSDLSS